MCQMLMLTGDWLSTCIHNFTTYITLTKIITSVIANESQSKIKDLKSSPDKSKTKMHENL